MTAVVVFPFAVWAAGRTARWPAAVRWLACRIPRNLYVCPFCVSLFLWRGRGERIGSCLVYAASISRVTLGCERVLGEGVASTLEKRERIKNKNKQKSSVIWCYCVPSLMTRLNPVTRYGRPAVSPTHDILAAARSLWCVKTFFAQKIMFYL